MYFVKVYVTYKESILDPQGEAVKEAVHRLGFTEVAEIRVGKYFEMHVQQTEAIEEKIEQICDQLLANVNMESYRFEILSLEKI